MKEKGENCGIYCWIQDYRGGRDMGRVTEEGKCN